MIAYSCAPVLAIAGGLFWTTFNGRLTAVDAFTTLAIVSIIVNPLMSILQAYPTFRTITACYGRIQKYLILAEARKTGGTDASSEQEDVREVMCEKKNDSTTGNAVIKFNGAHIAPDVGAETILHEVSFEILSSQFTTLVGPVGAGKTTLLRTILGETVVSQGGVERMRVKFAYCGQKTWLRNVTIRANIISVCVFERPWYDKVVWACCLENDLQQLPGGKGDETLAGSNGANLSGGQKHRVVSNRVYICTSSWLMYRIKRHWLGPYTHGKKPSSSTTFLVASTLR